MNSSAWNHSFQWNTAAHRAITANTGLDSGSTTRVRICK